MRMPEKVVKLLDYRQEKASVDRDRIELISHFMTEQDFLLQGIFCALKEEIQSLGVTPHQYILQRRIEKAKYLLQHSQLSIAAIASKVGFCDRSHLTRYFKRIVGITPKQLLQRRMQ